MPSATVTEATSVPLDRAADDPLGARCTLGAHTGFDALEQSVLECGAGRSHPRSTAIAEEVLFVLSGRGTIAAGGASHPLEPETGAYLPPRTDYTLHNDGPEPLRMIHVRIPDPVDSGDPASTGVPAVSHLAEQAAQAATTDRQFRIVADPEHGGLRSATHFVGYIPTKRAPEHFHTYDEVIYVLDGEGSVQVGDSRTEIGAGSCIQLPARTVHCLENTGAQTMRVVAVFRPAGSPAEAYYPDGTPAYAPAAAERAP